MAFVQQLRRNIVLLPTEGLINMIILLIHCRAVARSQAAKMFLAVINTATKSNYNGDLEVIKLGI